MAATIHCMGVLVVVDPVAVAVVAAYTVMVGWVRVVLIVAEVKMVGDSIGCMPIGLFWMIEASRDVSLLSLSLVKWCFFAGS